MLYSSWGLHSVEKSRGAISFVLQAVSVAVLLEEYLPGFCNVLFWCLMQLPIFNRDLIPVRFPYICADDYYSIGIDFCFFFLFEWSPGIYFRTSTSTFKTILKAIFDPQPMCPFPSLVLFANLVSTLIQLPFIMIDDRPKTAPMKLRFFISSVLWMNLWHCSE